MCVWWGLKINGINMLIHEFRIPMPLTLQEYRIGQLYSTMRASLEETGGGEGVKIAKNEPYTKGQEKGQYTKKLYFLKSKVPAILRPFAPKGSTELHEESWNSFPTGKTVINNPGYMKDNFWIQILTHVLENDKGTTNNIFDLDKAELEKREVVMIDIANDKVKDSDYDESTDPAKFKAKGKKPKGPLGENWIQQTNSVITVYKLVKCKFKWWGLQARVEQGIMDSDHRFFTIFHRKIFCWYDEYYDKTLEDIRKIEKDTQIELEKRRRSPTKRGTKTI